MPKIEYLCTMSSWTVFDGIWQAKLVLSTLVCGGAIEQSHETVNMKQPSKLCITTKQGIKHHTRSKMLAMVCSVG
jgi:hypothetical protein